MVCKKKKFKANLIINLQPEIEDNKLSTANISNIKNKSKTWCQNSSANKSNLYIKKEKNSNKNELDLEVEKFRENNLKVNKK